MDRNSSTEKGVSEQAGVCELQILWMVEVLGELLSCVKEALINVLFEFVIF